MKNCHFDILSHSDKHSLHWNNFIIDWVFLTDSQGYFLKEDSAIPSFGRRLLEFDICTCIYYFDMPASRIDFV